MYQKLGGLPSRLRRGLRVVGRQRRLLEDARPKLRMPNADRQQTPSEIR